MWWLYNQLCMQMQHKSGAALIWRDKGHKKVHEKGHAFLPGHHASHICHKAYCGFANSQFQLRMRVVLAEYSY